MKKSVKVFILLLVAWILAINAKNFYLFLFYKHGKAHLLKISDQNWHAEFETYQHGIDEKHEQTFIFDTNGHGIFTYNYYRKKIDKKDAKTYSWRSLLPYTNPDTYKCQISYDSMFITFFPGQESLWKDTVFAKYKVVGDQLFVDRNIQMHRYESPPTWGFEYSEKPSVISIVFPLNFFVK